MHFQRYESEMMMVTWELLFWKTFWCKAREWHRHQTWCI